MTARAGAATLGTVSTGPRPRVVVAEPDPAFLGLLRELLRDEGYEALVPPEPDDPALSVTAHRPVAVVLGVPYRGEAAALRVLDRLRRDRATAGVPIVVCTTAPAALEGLVGRQAEGLHLLRKPFDLERLLALLAQAVAGGWQEPPAPGALRW